MNGDEDDEDEIIYIAVITLPLWEELDNNGEPRPEHPEEPWPPAPTST